MIDYDTASGADAYSVQLTEDGTLYFSEAKNDELAVFTNIQTDTADQTSADRTYDESSGVALWSAAPSITGSAGSLAVTQATSTVDGNSNTIYIGHNDGLSVIQEKAGDATNGAVKYYTNNRITEEMTKRHPADGAAERDVVNFNRGQYHDCQRRRLGQAQSADDQRRRGPANMPPESGAPA